MAPCASTYTPISKPPICIKFDVAGYQSIVATGRFACRRHGAGTGIEQDPFASDGTVETPETKTEQCFAPQDNQPSRVIKTDHSERESDLKDIRSEVSYMEPKHTSSQAVTRSFEIWQSNHVQPPSKANDENEQEEIQTLERIPMARLKDMTIAFGKALPKPSRTRAGQNGLRPPTKRARKSNTSSSSAM